MQHERERKPVDTVSKQRSDVAVNWLRATLQRRLGMQGDYGEIRITIKIQDGEIPGSMILVDELHVR